MTYHDLKARILQYPSCHSWTYADASAGGFHEEPVLDTADLSDKWKVLCCIIAYNKIDRLPNYRTLERVLKLKKPALVKIIKELKAEERVSVMPTASESTGLMSGSGFYAE